MIISCFAGYGLASARVPRMHSKRNTDSTGCCLWLFQKIYRGERIMKFTFNQLCELLTGYPSDDMLLPEKNADWQYVARQLASDRTVTREEFQAKYKKYPTLSDLFHYLTGSGACEIILDSSCNNSRATNRLYQRLAKACLKCSQVASPTAWLKENNLSTFEQFCFRFMPTEGCQIED